MLLVCYFCQAGVTTGFIKTKNPIKTTKGFNENNINELENQTKNYLYNE